MLALQAVIGLALLLPRAASAPVAKLLTAASGNAAAKSAVLTVAGAVGAMTVSSLIQLYGVMESLKKGSQYGDRALALNVEELRALLALVLGVSNLALLFLSRALAAEQLAADKAKLNLEVLQRQAKGLQAEYTRATSSKAAGGGGDGGGGDEAARLRGQVDALIREKAALQAAADEAAAARRGAQAQVEAMRDQSKGLEREYDRLLAEHDRLRRDYDQATGGRIGGGGKKAE
ncbi:hypothetical protein MNEG_3089 [Monoraphidium neglectum]|uniref:Endoplasmic reticulum transmembrane protein n=1 Tax=Monoraphidium neglectum TaxID=145388 RepID=A0A0D2K2W1_9CHLO|nr:hypothetical protein MNEG_3089 [Monoraphidium neglectum]KIZ04873.1 hypothetical protein MNEG_3089 [Monoraphidium neglectum]|eukprot:XP_013903892.1 hypothetical protein MNEG_3089 [Monoraphidium neglectum]